jgi:hypothetical protein
LVVAALLLVVGLASESESHHQAGGVHEPVESAEHDTVGAAGGDDEPVETAAPGEAEHDEHAEEATVLGLARTRAAAGSS